MDEFSKEIFGERLKKIAKDDFGGIGKLASKMRHNNLSLYTSAVQEPKATFIHKLLVAGVDIIFLFTGKRGATVDDETKKKFEEMEQRLQKLESKLFRLTQENEELKEENASLRSSMAKDINHSQNKGMDKLK
ncbi:MAG: hypothetical protein AB1432_05675 [Bacteroidota bacterium]